MMIWKRHNEQHFFLKWTPHFGVLTNESHFLVEQIRGKQYFPSPNDCTPGKFRNNHATKTSNPKPGAKTDTKL